MPEGGLEYVFAMRSKGRNLEHLLRNGVTTNSTINDSEVVPRDLRPYFAQIVVLFAATFAAGKLGDVLRTVNSGGIGPVWPAAGIALGALLLWGYSVWPGVAAGAFLLTYSPLPHWAALVYAIGTTLAALISTYLLRTIAKIDCSLSRLRDVFALIVFGAIGSAVVSASIGVSTLYAGHVRGWSGSSQAWLIYWLGDSTGVLLITPLVLTFPALFRIRDRHRLTELAALLLLITVASLIIFGDLPLVPVRLHVLAFAVLPFVMWAAIRFGISATALSIVIIATIATVETTFGSGPFAGNTPFINAVLLDVFFVALSLTGLTLAAAIAEREQSERERERLVRERAEAEARLRFAAIVESSDDAIVSGDLDGIIVDWNAGAQHIYGYTEEEAVGQSITMLVPPELPGEENKILEKLRAGGRIEHFETIRVTKTGKRINVSLTISPIKDSSGRFVGISGIARDITERKRAEQELAIASERLRLAIESGSVGGWDFDLRTGKNVWFGKAHAQLGMAPEETLGAVAEFWARVHEDDRARLEQAFQVSNEKREEFAEDFRVVWRDGTTHWLRSRGRHYYAANGVPERMLGISVDITESKQAEQALREREQRLRLATQAGRMYAYEWDITTDVLMRSPEYATILGSNEPMSFTRAQFLDKIHPDDREMFLAIAELTPEHPITTVTYRLSLPRGEVWLKNSGHAFFDREGRMLRVIGMVADVTDQKLAEKALSSMTRKLVEAQEQERARIARELHDDISQRLALLAIELEQLKESPSEARSRVQELRKQMAEISNDVQAISHDLHSAQLEYLGVVAGMKSWCKEFGERRKMEIDYRQDMRSSLPTEIGLCLFRVLQEALHNAAKHSGVKRIEVQLAENSREIHLIVSDLGRGFDIEAARQGRGLGLTSMRERVRLVNGTIAIESKPMGGTTIHVRVPLGSEDAVKHEAV
jgi:PAS domain S-box-containing protein